jgi:threonine/homoserine/homoserine lactone efflux protein
MTFATILSLLGLAMVAGWTPGPNNALVATSGAQFGFRRTFPHVAGIGIGFPFMVFCVSLGLGAIFQQSAFIREGLRIVGIVVLLWFAWKVATAGKPNSQSGRGRPFTFLESASFQWINPKGWIMAISISSQFADPTRPIMSSMTIAGVFVFVGFTSASGWTLFGTAMQRWLTTDARANVFNWVMAATLLLSVFLIASSRLAV